MNSTQAAKNLAEAVHNTLDASEDFDAQPYHTIMVGRDALVKMREALDAYDERIAFEAGKPSAEMVKCGHGLFECCAECYPESPPSPAEKVDLGEALRQAYEPDEYEDAFKGRAAPSGVSDAMVERACRAHWDWWDEHGNTDIKKALTRQMRAAVEAVQPQPGRVEG